MSEPPAKNFWERLNNSAILRFLLLFAAGWALVQLMDYFEIVLVVFIFAAVLAFLLNYPTQWLSRVLPRGAAVGIVFALSLVIISAGLITIGLAILSQGEQLIASVSELLNSLTSVVSTLEAFLRARNIQVDLNFIEEQARRYVSAGLVSVLATAQAFLKNLVILIFIIVVGFFMLLNGEQLWLFCLRFIPIQRQKFVAQTIQTNFLGFFRGQLILVAFLTTTTAIVFSILKVPFAVLLAVIVSVFDAIPGIGATLGVSVVSLIVLSQDPWLALKVFVVCIILQQIQDNLIAPRVMQNSLNLNPVVIFFALLVGGRVAGILGIFLAVPIAGVIVSLLDIEAMRSEP